MSNKNIIQDNTSQGSRAWFPHNIIQLKGPNTPSCAGTMSAALSESVGQQFGTLCPVPDIAM